DPTTGALSFPPIPNRWLVQRFGGSPDDARATWNYQAWLVRSDAAADASGVAWPHFDRDPIDVERIGTEEPLTTPLTFVDEPARVTLTAVGAGDPLFAGYYPASRRVLGFHNKVADLPQTDAIRLTYLVTGWFSASKADPLQAAIASFLTKNDVA